MITPQYAQTMARYNRWQNQSLYAAAVTLSDTARRENRGAFFGSIQSTLSHLLWADGMWLHRFTGSSKPEGGIAQSATLHADWDDLKSRRKVLDETIIAWADGLSQEWLNQTMRWTRSSGGEMVRPQWLVVTHLFNHQTHHRGQVHAMLTAAGAKPEDTDVIVMEA